MNRFGAALSTEPDLDRALEECIAKASQGLAGERPHIALVFVSLEHREAFESFALGARERIGAEWLLGCSGETIIGNGKEIESGHALSLWLGHLPGASLRGFRMEAEVEDEHSSIHGMPDELTERDPIQTSLMIVGDPFTFPVDQLLEELNEHVPGLVAFGGMASGAARPGENYLFLQEEVFRDGALALLLEGVRLRYVVSQGCRPIGPTMVITRSELNVIHELAGKPPLNKLREIFEKSPEDEKQLLASASKSGALHIGQVVDEHISQPGRGDFLVRNVMGSDPNSGALVIGDYARRGRTVRFHIRDPESAGEDLRELLDAASTVQPPQAALLFSCNGRGERFFREPNHDANAIQGHVGAIPVAGFFAAGEVGPVGGRNFLHGFTASIALFDEE